MTTPLVPAASSSKPDDFHYIDEEEKDDKAEEGLKKKKSSKKKKKTIKELEDCGCCMSDDEYKLLQEEYRINISKYLYYSFVYNLAASVYFWLHICLFTIPLSLQAVTVVVVNNIPVNATVHQLEYFRSYEQQVMAINVLVAIQVLLMSLRDVMKFDTDSSVYSAVAKSAYFAYEFLETQISLVPPNKSVNEYRQHINEKIKERSMIFEEQSFETPMSLKLMAFWYTKPVDKKTYHTFQEETKKVYTRCCCQCCQFNCSSRICTCEAHKEDDSVEFNGRPDADVQALNKVGDEIKCKCEKCEICNDKNNPNEPVMKYKEFLEIKERFQVIISKYLYYSFVYNKAASNYFWLNIMLFTFPLALQALAVVIVNNTPIAHVTEEIISFPTQKMQILCINVLAAIQVCLIALRDVMRFNNESAVYSSVAKSAYFTYEFMEGLLTYYPVGKTKTLFKKEINEQMKKRGTIFEEQSFETPMSLRDMGRWYTKPVDKNSLDVFQDEIRQCCTCPKNMGCCSGIVCVCKSTLCKDTKVHGAQVGITLEEFEKEQEEDDIACQQTHT